MKQIPQDILKPKHEGLCGIVQINADLYAVPTNSGWQLMSITPWAICTRTLEELQETVRVIRRAGA